MRCPDCNKFVSFDEADPEVNTLEINEDGVVTAEVRIVNNCAECGTELKEATLEMEHDHSAECEEHKGDGHELSVEESSSERDSRSGYFKKGVFTPAYGRYAKTLYSATVSYVITCSCSDEWKVEGDVSDEIQASHMDEMV